MFVDLDWPLNASSLLSASAELLVYRPDALPVVQPIVSEHWRENITFHGLAYPKVTWGLPTLSLTTNSSWLPWGGLPCHSSALWCQYKYVLVYSSNKRGWISLKWFWEDESATGSRRTRVTSYWDAVTDWFLRERLQLVSWWFLACSVIFVLHSLGSAFTLLVWQCTV